MGTTATSTAPAASMVWRSGRRQAALVSLVSVPRVAAHLTTAAPLARCVAYLWRTVDVPCKEIAFSAKLEVIARLVEHVKLVKMAKLLIHRSRCANNAWLVAHLLQIARAASNVMARRIQILASSVLHVRSQMSSTLRGRRALHVLQAPVPMAIEQSVSAALGRPSQPSASAKTAPLRTSSTMLTRRARRALLGRNRMLIAQRVWHAKALLTPALAPIVLTVGPRMWSTLRGRRALHVLQALVPMPIEQSA